MNKTDKIFIAGASGMVGGAIIRNLVENGYTNLIGSVHSKTPAGQKDLPVKYVRLDLKNQAVVHSFLHAEKPHHIFLAAAKVGGIQANNTYPAQFLYENLAIQNNIIHSAWENGVKQLLFLGSSCIYPKSCPQPIKEEYLLSGPLEPTNEPYAIAKIAGIKMCEAYNRQYGTRFMAVMPTNLYGPNDNFDLETSHALPALLRKTHLAGLAENNDWEGIAKDEARYGSIPKDLMDCLKKSSAKLSSVPVWGTGKPRREFLHVADMADACVFLMNLDDKTISDHFLSYPDPCFVNVGTGIDCTIHELAEMVKKFVGFNGKIEFDASKPDGTPQKLLDVSRLAELGWKAKIDLYHGIKNIYQWYRGYAQV